jgi:hypothetical protein
MQSKGPARGLPEHNNAVWVDLDTSIIFKYTWKGVPCPSERILRILNRSLPQGHMWTQTVIRDDDDKTKIQKCLYLIGVEEKPRANREPTRMKTDCL